MKTLNFKKALAFTALTLTPALALTSSAQASPAYRAPVQQRVNNAPAWNNNSRQQAPRFDARSNDARSNQAQHFDPRQQDVRAQNNRDDDRFDARRNDTRFDSRRDNGNSNSTAKIIGAGIVGAILGAVLSR